MIPSENLIVGGVDYIELRSIDLNPFEREGINKNVLMFIELLLIFCFFRKSELLTKHDIKEIKLNDISVSMHGRDHKMFLRKSGKSIPLSIWGKEIVSQISCLVDDIGINSQEIENCLDQINSMIENPDITPSAKLLNSINEENINYYDFGKMIASSYREHYHEVDISKNPEWIGFDTLARESLNTQASMETNDDETFQQFLVSNFFQVEDK